MWDKPWLDMPELHWELGLLNRDPTCGTPGTISSPRDGLGALPIQSWPGLIPGLGIWL